VRAPEASAGPAAAPAAAGVETGGSDRRWRNQARSLAHYFLRSPECRPLRWLLAIGLAVRLVLIPLTSWGIDTAGFVFGNLQLIYTGDPYSSDLFFNPPFAPVVQSPLVLLAVLITGSQHLVGFFPEILPAAVATGMASPLVPIPIALLAIKLPLLLSDAAVAVVLWKLVRARLGTGSATWVAAGWFLNPLVVWASAVHGEPDTFAALFMLLALWMLLTERPFPAGVFLSLAVFTKLYPLLLLPLAIALLATSTVGPAGREVRWRVLGRFGVGLVLGAAPFLIWMPGLVRLLTQGGGSASYGGLSVLVVYNAAVPRGWGVLGFVQSWPHAVWLLYVLMGLAAVAAVGGAVLLARDRRAGRWPVGSGATPVLAALAAWVVVGALVAAPVPQSENVVGLLPLLLLALPALGRVGRWGYVVLSAAALGLYFALLTPAAYFYPLATDLGPSAVDAINTLAIGYASSQHGLTRGIAWLVVGLLGGSALIALWLGALNKLVLARRSKRPSNASPEPRGT